jgi:hypothetical protein
MKRFLFVYVGLLGLAGLAVAARVEADPNKEYPITPEAGPWLICAASYRGPHAKELAKELALVIRQQFNMPAYLFDRGGEDRAKQFAEVERLRSLGLTGRIKIVRIEEQFAVLVGGYKDMAAGRKALEDFRKLRPPEKFCDRGVVREFGKNKDGQEGYFIKEVLYNPFQTSFVVHNPSVPHTPDAEAKGADPFLKKLNAGESLSLLSNPKPWTLTVKVFGGPTMIQERNASGNKFMDMLGLGAKAKDTLDAAGLQAHALAELLRKMKPKSFDAYVLHTRHQSIVTVGGYDGPNDPQLLQDQQTLSRLKLQGAPAEMQLFAQPLPMEVPRP